MHSNSQQQVHGIRSRAGQPIISENHGILFLRGTTLTVDLAFIKCKNRTTLASNFAYKGGKVEQDRAPKDTNGWARENIFMLIRERNQRVIAADLVPLPSSATSLNRR